MAEPATILPAPAEPARLAADLSTRILELAIAWARAHDARNVRDEHELAAYLRATIREVAPHLGPVQFEPADRIRETLNTDGAAYEVRASDDGLIALHIWDALGDDALVNMSHEQAARLRAHLGSILLGTVKP